jgi:hypothetical protein
MNIMNLVTPSRIQNLHVEMEFRCILSTYLLLHIIHMNSYLQFVYYHIWYMLVAIIEPWFPWPCKPMFLKTNHHMIL